MSCAPLAEGQLGPHLTQCRLGLSLFYKLPSCVTAIRLHCNTLMRTNNIHQYRHELYLTSANNSPLVFNVGSTVTSERHLCTKNTGFSACALCGRTKEQTCLVCCTLELQLTLTVVFTILLTFRVNLQYKMNNNSSFTNVA